MCKPDATSYLRALPKVEQHIHIEGSLEPYLLFELAARNEVTLPKDDAAFASQESLLARYKRFTSLDDFLHYYYIGMSVLITSNDFENLAWNYFQKAASDGVKHAEVFFDPQAHISRGIKYETILNGFLSAKTRASKELGISINMIACFLRHLPAKESLDLFHSAQMQASFHDGHVIGIGLDSSEADFPPQLFTEMYSNAKDLGLHRTAHAAEEGPVENITHSLDDLHCQRIDHGLRVIEDADIMARVAREKVLLTLCPVSNVLLRCVPTLADVPIRKLLDAGVRFSLNSDDPAYFGAYILDVYIAVHETFDLSIEDWNTICKNGIEGSWCSQERKDVLLEDLSIVVTKWKAGSSMEEDQRAI